MSKDEQFLKRLLTTFKIEAAEHVEAISSGLVEMEKTSDPSGRAELIERVFRETHSLKGAARTVSVSAVEDVSRSMENIFSNLKKNKEPDPRLFDLLHNALDLLRKLLGAVDSEAGTPDKPLLKNIALDLDREASILEKKGWAGAEPVPESHGPGVPPNGQRPAGPLTEATVRLEKTKLDELLLRTEGLLQVKQFARERSSELREILGALETMEKQWTAARNDIRVINTLRRRGLDTPAIAAPGVRLPEFMESGRDRIRELRGRLAMLARKTENDRRQASAMVDGLLEGAKRMSMTPFSTLLDLLPGMVRNLLSEQGKEADLSISGGEVEVDRRILEEMKDPLMHLVRNCVDHGLERPAERAATGKPAPGRISVSVTHGDSGKVELAVSDDGSGIDAAKVRMSAVKLGILSPEEAEKLDEERSRGLVFRSGVSTSPIVTDLSGRGLGLAIVQEKVERLRGVISCESLPEKGALFRMLLPVTLASVRGLLVSAGGRSFVIPAAYIRRVLRVPRDRLNAVQGRQTLLIDGAAVPLVSLAGILEICPREKDNGTADFVYVAIVESDEKVIAFEVDEMLYEQEFLVKGLGRQLRRVRNVIGATVTGAGGVAPVLNVSDLIKSAVKGGETAIPVTPQRPESELRRSLLVVEDSATARTLLKNILQAAGYDVIAAVDGVDAYALLKSGAFDLVVSDVDMPRMNGFELTAKIRSEKALADLPVVLVTALDSRADRERGIDVGANAYIVKSSFDQSNLLEVIKRLL
jgi:two-component system chemotaxis sensor kinase CheA